MGSVYKGLPIPIVNTFMQRIKFNTFIETGRFQGESALWASNFFKEVYTIEASKSLYDEYHDRLSKENIRHIYGDSRQILQKLIESSIPTRLIWLDAHWVDDQVSYGKGDEAPVLGELLTIPKGKGENFIMIDDARYFLSPNIPLPHNFKKWPNVGQIITLLRQIQDSDIVFIFDDVIISPPKGTEEIIGDELHSIYMKNYERKSERKISTILNDFRDIVYHIFY